MCWNLLTDTIFTWVTFQHLAFPGRTSLPGYYYYYMTSIIRPAGILRTWIVIKITLCEEEEDHPALMALLPTGRSSDGNGVTSRPGSAKACANGSWLFPLSPGRNEEGETGHGRLIISERQELGGVLGLVHILFKQETIIIKECEWKVMNANISRFGNLKYFYSQSRQTQQTYYYYRK